MSESGEVPQSGEITEVISRNMANTIATAENSGGKEEKNIGKNGNCFHGFNMIQR